MPATARLSYSEVLLVTVDSRQSTETGTDEHGICTSFLVSTQQMESAELVCDFDAANVPGDTTQIASAGCS